MTVSDKEALIRARLEELTAYRDEEDKGLTQQAMADRLNAEGITSLTDQAWSKYSIRRILKRFGLNATPPGSAVSPPPSRPEDETTGEHKLTQSSPLMQWDYYESVRDALKDLMTDQDSDKSLAKKLNKAGVLTADGSPWDGAAVARVLRILEPTSSIQHADDLIRQQIKEGRYDTEEEYFVCLKRKTKGKPKEKGKEKIKEKTKAAKKAAKGADRKKERKKKSRK